MNSNDYKSIFRQMEREMDHFTDQVLRGFFDSPQRNGRFWQPHVDIHESADELQVNVELPGVSPDGIAVSLSPDDRVLTVAGVRKESQREREGREKCHQLEIYFGPFERRVQIPNSVNVDREAVRAAYRDGFLLITLPKKTEPEREATRIPVIDASELSDEAVVSAAESRETNDRS